MSNLEYTSASEIILPPGSTSDELQEAINHAASEDTIVICGDMPFTGVVTLPAGKEITLQSDAGHNWVMSQSNLGLRHFSVAGTLILKNLTLDGMYSSTVTGGGGINANGGSLAMHEGVIIQNCYASGSGGAIYLTYSNFTMNGGIISGNISNHDGGAIFLSNSDFTMISGIISDNTANNDGGGVVLLNSSSFVMAEGIVSGNSADSSGGGFILASSSSLIVYEGIISNNTANYGGGIYMTDSSLAINAGIINGNKASYGGGIYSRSSAFGSIHTSVNTVFSCNRANTAYEPPADAGTQYPDMQFASVTITNHPLNNYDISYMIGVIIDAAFHITYDANGGTGEHTGPGIEPCAADTALPAEDTGISRYGYTFTGWNTWPNGSGDSYAAGDEITVSSDLTLYAQWAANLYTVTYDANGGSGSYADNAAYDTIYTVLSAKETGVSRMLHILLSWNTQPDGSGNPFAPGDTFIISGIVTLYAQWKEITRHDAINLLLTSIAAEELAIAHILNSEGERLQYVLGTLEGKDPGKITVCDIIAVNGGIQKTLQEVIRTEMLLQFKMEYAAKLDGQQPTASSRNI